MKRKYRGTGLCDIHTALGIPGHANSSGYQGGDRYASVRDSDKKSGRGRGRRKDKKHAMKARIQFAL